MELMGRLVTSQLADADVVAVSKVDVVDAAHVEQATAAARQVIPSAEFIRVSSVTGEGLDTLVDRIVGRRAPNARAEDDACYLDHGVSGYGVAIKLHHDQAGRPGRRRRPAPRDDGRHRPGVRGQGSRFIGHIKSHLVCAQGTLKADTIGINHPARLHGSCPGPPRTCTWPSTPSSRASPKSRSRRPPSAAAHVLAERHGFRVVKEREHLYFDEYDFQKDEDYLDSLRQQFEATTRRRATAGGREPGGRWRRLGPAPATGPGMSVVSIIGLLTRARAGSSGTSSRPPRRGAPRRRRRQRVGRDHAGRPGRPGPAGGDRRRLNRLHRSRELRQGDQGHGPHGRWGTCSPSPRAS